ncbi:MULTISPECIES: TIGR03118 family protein [Sphingomonas]|nr:MULTISPECIES: TIGR03118 family protein [Sphingomonas]MBA2919051.1 TIGR03118 family protein [Sphingomonas sp. CGMCC 1.13658]
MAASSASAANQSVAQINLVTDDQMFLASQGFAPAATQDADLINPWGMSFSASSPFWISDQGVGKATLYNGFGAKQGLTVTIPGSMGGPSGPTGQVFNPTTDFVLPADGAKANFIFANLNGTFSGWNNGLGTNAAVAAITPGAIYTGLAMGSTSGGQNRLYAANAGQGRVDVFDSAFMLTSSSGFVDPNLPAGLAPFNIVNVGGQLYVTYAPPGPDADEAPLGTGVVDIFTTDGAFVRRFATGGNLLSPWGVAKAPAGFGAYGGAILIGNFAEEDGFINAFRESDGAYLGMLATGADPFRMPYLWSLAFRTGGVGVDPAALYFTAGIGDEEHGLFGQLTAVPEPATWALMLAGFACAGARIRKDRAQLLPG